MLRRSGALFLLVLGLPALAAGQSMGEVAKKERERREKLRQTGGGSAPAVDADQLAAQPQPQKAASQQSPPARQDDEQYWRSRVAAARLEVDEMQRRYDALDRMIRFGQGGQRDENGVRRIYSQQDMKLMADSAQADLAAAKAALETLAQEGRRAGALPGWFR